VAGRAKKDKKPIWRMKSTERKIGRIYSDVLIPSEKVYELRNGLTKATVRERNFFPGFTSSERRFYSNEEANHVITSIRE